MVVQDSPDTRMTDLIPKGGGKNTSLGLPVDRKHRLKHRFEVVKKLGQGTYGKVQLAVNKETGQEVAIKTIKKSKIESDQDLVRIRREIQIMSSVQHPHIIHIYEVFENKEKIVLVMQYASGGELYDYLSEKKILNDNEARRIFRQIAAAIYYCHKNKICHRDLKLENVLLDERGNAKIADFGLSNVFDDRHLLATYCGSPLYASPEIVKGTPYYGPEVDCWSMGVLLYTLVYGAMPFDGSNFKRLVKQISEGDYYEPKKKSEATGLIRRLLTVNPAKRASIIDICSDWWVNTGYEHSLLQVAEDTANLTPVRLDLLVALAPVSPPPVGGNKFKPSFNTPTVAEAANVSSGVEDSCEEAAGSHEENGEMSSSSFAYVSGGMASEMNVSTENPDDIFHQEHDASDEEFISADLAAALEGQCIKRPAEKSFDGSMVRVSSIAHKSKKPKKSDSLAASKNNLLRVSAPSPDTASSSGQRTDDDENEQLAQITKTDTLTAVDQVMTEVDHEKTPEADTVKKAQPTEEATNKPKEEDEQQPKTEETETAKKEPFKKKIVKKTTPESGDGTKKVKRKIVSSSAKKAAEKNAEGSADSPPKRSESPSKARAESPLKVNQRAESPAKSKSPVKGNKSPSPSKADTSSKTKTSESPSRSAKTSESPSRTTKSSESPSRMGKTSESPSRATKTSDSPSRTTKTSESPSRTINKSSESPPKVTVAKDGESTDKKEPKKSGSTPGRILLRKRSETSPEKKPLETKPAAIGAARKPGKLVIPRFLESTTTTPSPKVVAETPKKLVIPIRSVSDAKKAFEVKTKPTPVNPATPKKTTEKDENSTIKSEIEVQDEKEKVPTTAEETKDTVVAKVNDDKETKTKETKLEDVPAAMETEKTEKTLVKKEEVPSVKDENKTTTDKPVEESEEEKKVAAKSILKKTLARARLAERKLSQQSSMDSETGSQCVTPPASLVTTPTSQVNATSYFKIPKPYSKENLASNVESKAEITLGKKINKEEKKNNKEETIWGSPMSPSSSSNSKLKRSVLSSSIESDMNNWRTEVEESLKRLSPEGAAEENHSYTSQTSQDSDGGTGPAPITRSYKKFTFTKDGSTITETGEVYTEPKPDGTWTKVEKKTKVTTNQTPVATERKFDKTFKETSPLRHSDSQSSSGSNDVFDDIFDSWTGDSVFGNLLKMDSAFSRFAKDSLRRDRRRESLRRPKSDRTTTRPSRDWTRAEKLAAGHSTDRESSDNEDDFDFHFDGSHPVSYGSQGLMNFMKAMHLNFNDHLRSFKDRHRQGSFSRSLSRDRDDASRPRDLRGRSDSKSGLSGYSAMNRSTSRDRTSSSPRESVLRFVVDHPRRQDSTRSEPRTYHHQRMNSWGSRERLGRDGFDDNVRESGVGSSWDGYASDHGAKFSSPIDSPEVNTDRASLYGSGRPKGFQRYRESLSKEGGESPSTPQSTRSGPELLDRSKPEGLSDNRRRRVEHWLETNPEDLVDPDNAYAWTTRSLLRDMPEFSSLYEGLPRPKSGFMRYSRSSSDKLADFDERPIFQESGPTSRDRVSNRSPMFRTISEVQVSGNPRNAPQDPSLRDQYDFGSAGTLNDPPVAEKPPKMTRATSQGSATFTRSSSGNPTHVEIVSNPDGSLEMETPVNPSAGSGSRTPVLRMRVSFNGSSESPRVQTTRESPVWQGGAAPESTGLWNQERPVSPLWSSDFQDGSSLLEALKNRGYRNVISQRLHHNQYSGSSLLAEDGDREAERVTAERGGTVPSEAGPRAGEAQPNPPSGPRGANEADAAGGSSTPKRGKACNSASSTPAETERDACCMMETNPPPERNVAATTTIVDDDCNDELDRSENSEEYIVEKISSKITETPDIIAPVVTKLNGHNNHHGYAHHGHSRAKVNSEKSNHHHDEAASDGTLTPDSLDSSKERAARRSSKSGYEEESVSERILRKSFYSRFNDDRPKRRSFVYQDNNLDFSLQDLRGSGGLWSRFSDPKTDSTIADDPYSSPLIRRANRRTSNTGTPEKRSSANLEESSWLRKSESNSSYDYTSDDGLWASKPPLPSRRSSPKSTNGNGSSSSVGKTGGSGTASEWYDKPTGSLWSVRKDSHSGSRSYREPSVIDIVPDLSESRRSSRSSFSFYSPTVTPRSPVFSSRSLVQDGIVTSTTDSQHEDPGSGERAEPKTRRRSLVEPQFVVHEETRSRQSSGASSVSIATPNLVQNGSSDVIKASTSLNDANGISDFDITLAATNNINMIKPKEAILLNE